MTAAMVFDSFMAGMMTDTLGSSAFLIGDRDLLLFFLLTGLAGLRLNMFLTCQVWNKKTSPSFYV
jgi:hypothetical protein